MADTATLSSLYKATVLPVLDYCCTVWDLTGVCLLNKLEIVQTFAVRLVMKRCLILSSLFILLRLVNVEH